MVNKKRVEKVGIVKCGNYEQKKIDKVIQKVLKLSEIEIPKNKKVLIKPNIVVAEVKKPKAVLTNPMILEAICKILKKNNCKIYIGESSFMDTDIAFKNSGVEKIAKKYGKLVIFEQDKLIKINDKKAKVLKNFNLAKTIKDVDLIINVPKLKTHQLTKYTGAIKNLYGCIPGGMKQKLHSKAKGEEKFSKLLVDIYQNIKPEINIMDGIIGMEGRGPTSGKEKKIGYILASKNAVSLDVVSSKLIGYKPKNILMIKEAVARKLGSFKFSLEGMNKVPCVDCEKPFVSGKMSKRVLKMLKEKPIVVDKKKCIKCGRCAAKCPVKAIKLSPFPVIDKKKCIRCFCCMEICPKDALSLKE